LAKSSPICEILPKYGAVIWLNLADFATFSHKIILKRGEIYDFYVYLSLV
jgi:hypothetical protein